MKITNKYDFIDLDHLDFSYKIIGNGKTEMSGVLNSFNLKPHESRSLTFNLFSIIPRPGVEYFLLVEARLKKQIGFFQKITLLLGNSSGCLSVGLTYRWKPTSSCQHQFYIRIKVLK